MASLLFVSIGLLGCAQLPEEPAIPENEAGFSMIEPTRRDHLLAHQLKPGDVIEVLAPRRAELTRDITVDPAGEISYPYLGNLRASGKSPSELAQTINDELVRGGWYVRPEITVGVKTAANQFAYILGEVKDPGPIDINGRLPLLAALGRVGGETYNAKMDAAIWIRTADSPAGAVRIDLSDLSDPAGQTADVASYTLIAGDILYLPDTALAGAQRFAGQIYDIVRAVVEIERGLVLYPEVSRFLERETNSGQTIISIAN